MESSPLPAPDQLEVTDGAHFNVVIIGSGAGGGTLARHLVSDSNLKVLVLERGDWLPQEPQNWDAEEVMQ
ncbi:MAG: NAD(P)-binding protein, partial [bacterium]